MAINFKSSNFYQYDSVCLRVVVYYIASNGDTKYHDMLIQNGYTDADKLLLGIMSCVTQYIRENCTRIEVSVPQRTHYGKLVGGQVVVNYTREDNE